MKAALRVILALLALVGIAFILASAVSWHDAEAAVRALSWTGIAVIAGIVVLVSLLKGTRFFLTLRFGGIRAPLRPTLGIFLASQAFTAMPGGEIWRAMLFKRELGIHLKEVAGPVFLQALLELWTATFCVLAAAPFVQADIGWWLAGLCALLAFLSLPLVSAPLLLRLSKRLPRQEWLKKSESALRHFRSLVSWHGKAAPLRFWMIAVGLALAGQASNGGLLWFIAHTEGIRLTFPQGLFATAMGSLIQGVIAVIPGGLGVTEGGLVGILSGFAIPWRKAVLITLLYRVATLPLLVILALGLLAFLHARRLIRPAPLTRP